jgi:hypothetical protein
VDIPVTLQRQMRGSEPIDREGMSGIMVERRRRNTRMRPIQPAPEPMTERPFTVADGLVLIGAMAVGLAFVRGWESPRWCSLGMGIIPGQTLSPARRILHATEVAASWTIPFALSLTVALLILRLRPPRPPIRRIARQPGVVACSAALAAVVFRLGQEVFCWVLGYLTRPQSAAHLPSPPFVRYDNPGFHPPAGEWLRNSLLETFPILVSPSVAVAVAVGWCVLLAGGRWRADARWIDRSGRWLGRFWIGLGIVLAALMEVGKFVG